MDVAAIAVEQLLRPRLLPPLINLGGQAYPDIVDIPDLEYGCTAQGDDWELEMEEPKASRTMKTCPGKIQGCI